MNSKPTRQFVRANPRLAVFTLCAASAVFVAVFPAMRRALAQRPQATAAPEISASALNQIAALAGEKFSRTSAQRKIDSQILATIRMRKGESVAPGVAQLQTDVEVTPDDRAKVDIRARVTADLLEEIARAGGRIIASVPRFDAIRALIPLDQIEALAALPDVGFINRAVRAQTRVARNNETSATTNALTAKGYSGSSFEDRAQRLRWQLPNLLANFSAPGKRTPAARLGAATVVSEGDKTHRAAEARTLFGVDGSGVKIGVLSDSVDNLSASQTAGELGSVTVLPGQNGVGTCGDFSCSGEGTAMLEIIHDLAPGAQLYFATAFISEASFAENILDLRAAGCDIIVDDVSYLDESPFQDSIVAQAINTVTADGALYFSAAGNDGNLSTNVSSVWEGDFANGGQITVAGRQLIVHTFGSSVFNSLTSGGGSCTRSVCGGVALFWSDPLGGSGNDYDLYVLDSVSNVVLRRSDNFQTGSQDPVEFIAPLSQGERIVIVQSQGAPRFLHLATIGLDGRSTILSNGTSGTESGHATASSCVSVAAVPAASPFPSPIGAGANPAGPFPNPFTTANHIERFSSDGPRRVFYNSDGSAITPGNFTSTGGVLRQKPDIAAADGVSTSFPSTSGLNPFFGTSAAAPHAAAIAALLRSFAPSMTAAEVRSVLKSTAIDIETAGVDRDSGSGIVMAVPALQSVATGANLSSSNGTQTVTQGQNAVFSIAINRRNFAGTVNLSISGLPAGASASFNPASTTGNTSALTITTNSATANGTFTPSVSATASGVTIFPLSLGLTVNPSCSYSISPSARNFDSSAGNASIAVSAAGGCAWTAIATESWITINSGSPGNGGGTINYSVAANSGGARTGRILIANQTFVITQSGNNPAAGNWVPASKMRVARTGYSITLLQNSKVLVAGGAVQNTSTKLASAELYDPSTGTWSDTGSLNATRSSHLAVLLQNGKVLIVGGFVGSPESATQTAEIYDPITGTWTNTGSMTSRHGAGSATVLPNGKVLIAGGADQNGVVSKAELYDPTAGTFSPTGDMKSATDSHVAVLMQNGKVLTMGGETANFVTSGAQLYDPASGTWATTNNMGNARLFHSATLLANGKVIVAGGEYNSGRIQSTVEIYDPLAGTWGLASSMLDAIEGFTMTLLQDGKVLVTGGNGDFNNPSSAEIFDPATGRWRFTASMSVGRSFHSAVLLLSGNVLVVGGGNDYASAEIFSSVFTGNWSLTGSMITARWDHTATLLNNGKVLVVGGSGTNGALSSSELYDYTTGLWTKTGSLVAPRRNHTATLLSNGKVLVVGGNNGLLTLKSAELYDPNSGTWTGASDMLGARSSHAATLLSDGRVLITGGNNPTLPTNTAEIYDPTSGLWSSTANMIQPRSSHTTTLLPSGIVLLVGATDQTVPKSEIFNPATGNWTAFGGNNSRLGHTATLLLNGTVLVSGGFGKAYSSELFTQGSFSTSETSMVASHFFQAAALLPNGRVLIAGGDEGDVPGTAVSELYNQQSGVWQGTTDLIAAREFHTASLLPNGKVLVTGGVGSAGALSSAELYEASPGCSFSINQSSQNFPSGVGSGSALVTSGNGCLWSAVSNASFITVTAGVNGVGNGTVNFSVAASNVGNPRMGTITIADKLFTVTQAAGVTCTYSISSSSNQVSGFGGSGSFNITAAATDCAWTASSNANWITITPPSTSAGSATINYSFAPNGGAPRSGTITVAGQTHTVNQEAGCSIMPITAGSPIDGVLTTTDCHSQLGLFGFAYADRYSFSGTAGQQIFILQKATIYPPFLSLLKPDGTIAAQGYQNAGVFNARIPTSGLFTIPASGSYVIEASSVFDGLTGPYTLSLSVPNSPQLSASTYAVNEGAGSISITVNRTGDTSGAATVDYATADGTASQKSDYIVSQGTLRFNAGESSKTIDVLITNDALVEGNQTFSIVLSNPIECTLGAPGSAVITITDDDASPGPNPTDDASFFVRQHYADFLNRPPDAPGLAFWTNEIASCGNNAPCIEVKRINVSAAYFLSIEFQQTGYLVYRMYNATLNRSNNMPRYLEFMRDTQTIGRGVIVNQTGWEAVLEANKVAFANDFVARSEFVALYPTTQTPSQFVDALYAHALITPTAGERSAAIAEFGSATNTADTAARGRVLRRVAENATLTSREFNRSFVLMQYFGYLRRNPDDAPDGNLIGYNFWLTKLNQFNGNFVNAEMVKAFITSSEYRQRFGP